MEKMSQASPVARYYGGKGRLCGLINEMLPPHAIYVEPFFGGGSVFFRKEKSKMEFINDLDGFVINFWEVFFNKGKLKKLIKKLDGFMYAEAVFRKAIEIYGNQKQYGDIEKAWAFFIIINCGFNGKLGNSFGYGYHQFKGFGVLNKIAVLASYINRLRSVTIFNRDAVKVIKNFIDKRDAFMYLDPPYYNANMGHYSYYTKENYIKLLETLSDCQAKFILSSYPSDVLTEFSKKNNWDSKSIRKAVTAGNNGKIAKQKYKEEVLTYNFKIR